VSLYIGNDIVHGSQFLAREVVKLTLEHGYMLKPMPLVIK
jgi:hypothetical protein